MESFDKNHEKILGCTTKKIEFMLLKIGDVLVFLNNKIGNIFDNL